MNGYHVLWTKPLQKDSAGRITFNEVEALTWLVGILTWKRHNGRIGICTDRRGVRFLRRTRLLEFYDEVRDNLTELDLDPIRFWAGGKVAAIADLEVPFAIMDLDFVSWHTIPPPDSDVVGFFFESADDFSYRVGRSLWIRHGVSPEEFDAACPLNCAVTIHSNSSFKSTFARDFVKLASRAKADPWMHVGPYYINNAIVFAEQHYLSICARRAGASVASLTRPLPDRSHHESRDYLHLWNSKNHYEVNANARTHYTNYLRAYVKANFPKDAWWLDLVSQSDPGDLTRPQAQRDRVRLKGKAVIHDANVPVARQAIDNEALGPGESVQVLDGQCWILKRTSRHYIYGLGETIPLAAAHLERG